MTTYLDQKGKPVDVDDLVHYASRSEINSGWVQELLPDGKGVIVLGKNNRRTATIVHPEKQIIVVNKGYYKDRIKSKKRNRA